MRYPVLPLLLIAAGLALGGCKIVPDAPEGEAAIPEDASGDAVRNTMRVEETFASQLLPHVAETALPVADLRTALAGGLDAAGDAHGHRGAGAGSAWNFAVAGEGVAVEAKLDTRARKVMLDTDGDAQADVTLQLGPVIAGTALRDVAPFYNFDDFRDQIEFANLGRALNDAVNEVLVVPEGDLVGKTIAFTGVVPLRSASEDWKVTPTEIEVR
ncbi:MAG: DUF2291 domain-containing protein [Maritimibacter sp.]|nr:DUF2291 domain-containing protein [Maritimibacter sp.]